MFLTQIQSPRLQFQKEENSTETGSSMLEILEYIKNLTGVEFKVDVDELCNFIIENTTDLMSLLVKVTLSRLRDIGIKCILQPNYVI